MVNAARILVVDDDPRIAASLRRALSYEGYDVAVAADGLSALRNARERPPDLVVLDVMLPGLDGVEVCRRLRAGSDVGCLTGYLTHGVPGEASGEVPDEPLGDRVAILMLTARDATADRVLGLDSGADDYLTKPFSTDELLARVRALLRRLGPREPADPFIRFDDLALDPAGREAWRGGRAVLLTSLEFDLLACFLRHPRQVLNRDQLLDSVWGRDAAVTSNAVDVYVGYLRAKLEAAGESRLIQTVRGVGYVLRAADRGQQ